MRKTLSVLFAIAALAMPAQGQTPESIFRDYEDMRSNLDRMMMAREIEAVLRAFGASDEMTDEELKTLEHRVRSIFPFDFRHVHVLKTDDMGEGWRRELYAYWAGVSYIYATVLFHERDGELVAISFKFNTDIDALIEVF